MKSKFPLMTEKEVAAFLNVSISRLQKDRVAGRNLPFITIGKSVRYRMEDVLAFIEANTMQSTSAVTRHPPKEEGREDV